MPCVISHEAVGSFWWTFLDASDAFMSEPLQTASQRECEFKKITHLPGRNAGGEKIFFTWQSFRSKSVTCCKMKSLIFHASSWLQSYCLYILSHELKIFLSLLHYFTFRISILLSRLLPIVFSYSYCQLHYLQLIMFRHIETIEKLSTKKNMTRKA